MTSNFILFKVSITFKAMDDFQVTEPLVRIWRVMKFLILSSRVRLCSRPAPSPAARLHLAPRGWAGLCREEEPWFHTGTASLGAELMTYKPDSQVMVAPILGQSQGHPGREGAGEEGEGVVSSTRRTARTSVLHPSVHLPGE